MAGLGEACTHVAAVLFFLETSTRLHGTSTCTQQGCKWVIPSFQKDIPYVPLKELDISSAKSKKKKIDEIIATSSLSCDTGSKTSSKKKSSVPGSQEQRKLDSFFQELSKAGTKPAILSLLPEYSDGYVPAARLPTFPKPLQSLFDPAYQSLGYMELLDVCISMSVNITEEMSLLVEKATKKQSDCKLWFKYRAGRITASKLKQVF